MSSPNVRMCKYGFKCYRRNPQHFQEFQHPSGFKRPSDNDTPDNDNDKPLSSDNNNDKSSSHHNNDKSSSHHNNDKPSSHHNNDKPSSSSEKINLNKKFKSDKLVINKEVEYSNQTNSPFNFYLTKLNSVKENKMNNFLSVSIKDILSRREGNLIESAQFNYMFEIDWVIDQYDDSFKSLPLYIVYGYKRGSTTSDEMKNQTSKYPNIKLCGVPLFDLYGTHHTKMMLLRYDTGIRVVIHTANLIEKDWHQKTQGVWLSPIFPPVSHDKPPSDLSKTLFKTDLLDYLNTYRSKEIDYWCSQIKRHDLSAANVFLIASTPGRHTQDNKNKYGHLKVRKVLSEYGPSIKTVDSNWPVLCQFSSIGSLGPKPDSWLTSEFLISLSSVQKTNKFNEKPSIKLIFPTVENVRKSYEGYAAGGSLPYSSKTAQKQPYLKSYLNCWKSDLRGRSKASPHIKSYLRLSPNCDQISWFILTSANLSKAAWGCLEKNSTQLAIKSFELGVLFLPKIFGDYETLKLLKNIDEVDQIDIQSFPIHYDIPLTQYHDSDEPWTWDAPHTELPDCYGNVWNPT